MFAGKTSMAEARAAHAAGAQDAAGSDTPLVAELDRANLTGLVLGCIKAKFCKKICV